MNGSNKTTKQSDRAKILAALRDLPDEGDYVWDGKNEDERPLTTQELRVGIEIARKRGRPVGGNKESTTMRFDRDILEAFRAAGPGWQTRMNEALRQWLEEHPEAVSGK